MIKRVTSIFSILMLFIFTIGQSFTSIIANAQELNTTGFVDSFTIDKATLNSGETTRMAVQFSDKSGNQMKAGDTLTLTLPSELKGYSGTIPLNNDAGINFGTCQIKTTNVVCTFSDTVEKLKNIRGNFYFQVKAIDVAQGQTVTTETNLGTQLEKKTVTIIGPTGGGGGGSSPFSYKTGSIQPENTNEVQWVLNANTSKQNVDSDIVLVDTLQEGQTLNQDSLRIGGFAAPMTPQEFQAQGYGTVTFIGDNGFKAVINKDKANGLTFVFEYKANITDSGKKLAAFYNNYKVDYKVTGEEQVSKSDSVSVKNIDQGGGAQGDLPPKGTLRIVKHIAGDETKFIPNVSFNLYTESGQQIGSTYITDGQGMVEVPNLDPGNYYVQEVSAPDYLDFDSKAKVNFTVDANAQKGVKLMIPNKVKMTSVSGTKTWNDNNATDRPNSIQVELLQNGNVIQTQDVTAANNWNYKIADLPAYDNDGNAYTYTVKEKPIAGYKSEVNGYNITNTKDAKTSVSGTKTWNDNNAIDRPSSIQVELLQNGNVIQTKEVTAANSWKYTFADLAQYDMNGVAYTYTVKEQPVVGYKTEVNGYNITNTKVAKMTVEGTKKWKDGNATDRPSSIQVDLLQNGNVIQTKEVTAANDWKYSFTNVESYDVNGSAYTYTVKERPVAGYKSEINGYDITNTKVGQTTVEGTKTWKDGNATNRPTTIKVDLLQNGQVVATQEVSEATGWKYGFKDLAAYDVEGNAYKYEVKEQPVDGYKAEVNGYDITNTKDAKTSVSGTKTWNDNNATDRPSSIQVDLLQNGNVIQTQEVTAANGWNYTFVDLAQYDANGVAYTYTVKEKPVAGYKTEVNGYNITNTKVAKMTVEGTKTWKDGNATDRPTMIKVDLLQNGNVIKTQDVLAAIGWKYIFADLEAYDANGVAYQYEVKEHLVAGYKSEISSYDITNTKVGQTTVEGTKTWKDGNATNRPTTIKVDLLQNGKVINTKEVSAASEWKYAFTDLAAYDAEGNAYKYEIKEQPVDGYKSEVKGYDITNTKVAQTTVEGTKTWKDGNATNRPTTIKVDLLQNGKVIDTKEVSAAGEWKYAFTDLAAYDAEGNAYKYEVKEQPVDGYKSEVHGYDITNTKVAQTTVEGTKTWKDGNATDRPTMIKVDLLQNGNVIKTQDVLAAIGWKYIFADLEAYDANGIAYQYEVKEHLVAGYKSEVSGYDITNTKVGQTTVEGTKTWKDGNATNRPTTIKVDLLQNGKVIDTKEVSAAGEWKYAFIDLAAYDAEGNAYKYEVKEQPVDGYKSEVHGYDITNTKVAQTTVEGTKTWKDGNATNRPTTIKVDLLQNGKVIDTKEVSAAGKWKYAFTDLAAYDAEGNAYKYEVKEQPVDGYKSEVKGYDITNTKVAQTTVEGTKTWKDGNATNRPTTIKVDLLQNGKVIDTKEVSAAGKWKYAFTDLAAYDAEGNAYKYEVKEQPVDGYKSEVKGYDITNTKVAQTTVEGTKTWKDGNATNRPTTIKVDLLQNGKVIDTKEVSAAGKWKYAFTDLAAYDAEGNAYKYEVKEQPVDGYKSEVKGYDITNTKVAQTKVEGTKTWKDGNATNRPEMIKVDLLQNGKVIDTKEVSAAGEWKYAFTDLAAYDAEGNAYKYEVKEQPVDGYKSEVKGYDITNTKVAQTKVEGTKTWKDGNATNRPEMIKVDLLQNGKVIDTKEVSAAGEWKYAFTDLAAYDAEGNAYKYEVKEQPVDGYKSEVHGYDITNTKVANLTVEGTKTWNDNNATDRPSSIKVDLLQNGKVVDTKEATAATNWKYAFADVEAYDANGVAYKYEVKEQPVAGYQSDVHGYDITNTKVGETKVEGTKTWKDDNATDRPSLIKVDLLQNGKVVDTKEVTAATEWKYTFEKLQAYDANGVAYKYEVKEQPIAGYEPKVNGYDITNTKVGQTKVEGTKTWKDGDVKNRPEMIKIDLLQNGKMIATKEVSAAGEWKYAFTDLAAYDAEGNAYKYEVKEQPVDGYKSEVKGYDITNTKVGETKVEGTKTWKDDNAKDRPTMIKVDLLQNGKVIATKEVSAADEWKYAFTDLAAYDAEGNAYKYEVKEQPVNGYKSEVHGYDITNTKDPSTDPKDPSTDPKDPSTDPKDPSTDPKDPSTDPKDPSTDPKDPSTDPKDPSTDPKDPSTDPKNPSTQENSKTSVWLPKTGGTSMDMISYIAGMLLLALGGFVFVRQRMR
ncbi:Cna B-type domain-containing protein [Bacillus toyonensis]|uniref:Cna B-type domain-containing protein n=4 Tax=Bacillus toyonensis TaxID=155322 RepID=UPI001C0109CA|nr:Cna B-type domain-containing protein [Bacillus toyonensis]